jgi:predicted RecA/RadA family phage recombinase
MAKNEVFKDGDNLAVTVSHPASPVTGDPVRYGELVGVATTSEDPDSGKTSVTFKGVHDLSVKGTTGSDAAVAPGDKLYYVDANTPPISKTSSGRFVGYAVEGPGYTSGNLVAAGATGTIPVRLSN